jgi:hypothetical protein
MRPGDASALRVDPSIEVPIQRPSQVRARMRGPTQAFDLTVEPVVGASGYQFEIVGTSPPLPPVRQGSVEPTLTIFHSGDASGKWRVATVRDGLRSRSSPWRRYVARG